MASLPFIRTKICSDSVRAPSYLCKEEDKISSSSDLVQDTLQALGFSGEQSFEGVHLQGHTLHLLGAERPLGNHCLGLTLQSDYRFIDSVNSGTAGSIHYGQALLYRNTHNYHSQSKLSSFKLFRHWSIYCFRSFCWNSIWPKQGAKLAWDFDFKHGFRPESDSARIKQELKICGEEIIHSTCLTPFFSFSNQQSYYQQIH